MKKVIHAFDYAETICKALSKGVLLTTKTGSQINTMTIGWGHLGIEWNKPIFVAYVRESRFTREMLAQNPEFTINVPYGAYDPQILSFCGCKSGRDLNKVSELGLHLVEGDEVNVPGIREFPLTLECKVIYQQLQVIKALPEASLKRFYPAVNEFGEKDVHIAFYGEIVNAYLIEE